MENVTHPDAILIADLRQQLDASRRNEESLIKENKQFQQRVSAVDKQLSTEKSLREQKENELRFEKTESVNKKLTSEVQTLQREVTVLTGKNTSTLKRLEEQKQLLKQKDAEHEMTAVKKTENSIRVLHRGGQTTEEDAIRAQQKSAELRKEIENQTQQNKIQHDDNGCLKRQIKSLQSDKNELKLSRTEMSSQVDSG